MNRKQLYSLSPSLHTPSVWVPSSSPRAISGADLPDFLAILGFSNCPNFRGSIVQPNSIPKPSGIQSHSLSPGGGLSVGRGARRHFVQSPLWVLGKPPPLSFYPLRISASLPQGKLFTLFKLAKLLLVPTDPQEGTWSRPRWVYSSLRWEGTHTKHQAALGPPYILVLQS